MDTRNARECIFWFGDIRGFSTHTVRYGDEAALQLVGTFQELLVQQLDTLALRPRLHKSYGDGIMLVFPEVEREKVVHLAIGVQEAITARNRVTLIPLLLWVGIGLSQGTVHWLGGEPIGHAVNLAKRLAEVARGGQILLTEELGHHLESWPLVPQEYNLKGIGRQRAWELRWQVELARLELQFSEITLIGRWGRLQGAFELAMILTGDRRLRLEFNRELATRLEHLPRSLERRVLLRPVGHWLRRLLTQAPAGLGRELSIEEINVHLDSQRKRLILVHQPPRWIGGRLVLPLAQVNYSPDKLKRFLALLQRVRQEESL